MKRLVAGLALACALAAPAAHAATQPYVPNDPLYPRQWYLAQDHAFDFWSQLPVGLPPVRVGIVDSGVDFGHPDLQGRIAGGKSFVGGSWKVDTQGHGTFVAGMIGAATGNQLGIAGLAFPAQLLIAKVVQSDGTISTADEAKGIRWAVDNGARVINLSIGGLRDPFRPTGTRTRPSSRARSTTPSGVVRSWSPRSGTAMRRRPSRGGSRATRQRCRTWSGSPP